jgi:bifunctional ADP-heptose synthase (sugar kinase/adenylyltransferase)
VPPPNLDGLRAQCDRLVLGLEAAEDLALAGAAALASVDVVCAFERGTRRDALTVLRPDILLDPHDGHALAPLVESWGGIVAK